METLTLEEKVSQLFTIWVSGYFQNAGDPSYRQVVELVDDFGAGGVVVGRGNPMAEAALLNDLQRRADLPLLVAQDMEWGPGMRLNRTTTLPPAMSIGATRRPEYAKLAGYVTAREALALGAQHVYAPVADVNNNPANPIINIRSFSERPDLVASMTASFIDGVQQGGAIATAKHFPGHGDTATDSHLGLPILRIDRTRLDTLELMPFRAAIGAQVQSVMTGHLAVPALEPDTTVPASLSAPITQGLLREDLGFNGLIVTDALNMQGVTKNFGPAEAAVRAVEAGADVLLMSTDPYLARDAILHAIQVGRITEERINRSVWRILKAKQEMGLPRTRTVDLSAVSDRVGTRRHKVLEGAIARESLTLLRNTGDLLPITPATPRRVLIVTLNDSDDPEVGTPFVRPFWGAPGLEALATRRLDARSDSAHFAKVLKEADDYDAVIVSTFLQVRAWSGRIGLPDDYRAFLDRLIQEAPPVALVSFGNPYVTGDFDRQPDAYLAAYGAHEASQVAAAHAILGQSGTSGQLPVSIPGRYGYGSGITLEQVAPRLDLPEAVGINGRALARVDSLIRAARLSRAFPGATVAIGRGQTIAKMQNYGYYTYDATTPVSTSSLYDLASLTKVVATTTAAMKLYEAGKLDLDAPVVRYLPEFGQHGKENITIRQLLTHSSGLRPYLPPDARGSDREALLNAVMAEPLRYEPGTQSEYSGLGMITLMRVIETITGQPFDEYCEETIFDPLGMASTGFRPFEWTDSTRVVPTTDTTGVRFQGTVHDPIARQMNGVSGNAGLFSTAEDLACFATMLVNGGRIYGRQFLKKETIDLFTTRADVPNSTRALGWDTKSQEGYSSAGQYFGPNSFGHTGYTGTSMWVDPEQDLFAILLANRVYPDDTDRQISEVRPQFADLVIRSIAGPPEPLLPELPEERTQAARSR